MTQASGNTSADPADSGGGRQDVASPGSTWPTTEGRVDFVAVVARYECSLLRYARQLGCDADEAEDVVQETFLRLHRQVKKQGHESIQSPTSWLYRVAHNLVRDIGRRKGRQKNLRQHMVEQELTNPDQSVDLTSGLADMMQRDAVARAMDELQRLPEHQKQVILLKIIEGMKLREISEITGTSIGNVSYRLNQGLGEMARRLKEAGVV
jgi:RNA polymerase sigma-70 factor (ECF subfamily)